jgi:cytochrome c-type biogenesis protein CcmH/NrfF
MENGGDSQGENSCFHIKVSRGDEFVTFNVEPNTIRNVFILFLMPIVIMIITVAFCHKIDKRRNQLSKNDG